MDEILLCWSGGKDSALALHALTQPPAPYAVRALLTTVTAGYDRISMHGVRVTLLERQAAALGLPLDKVVIPQDCSNEIYGVRMKEALERHRARGVRKVAFGDIFLEDLRAYREKNLEAVGMEALFPLWKRPTADLARRFLALGFRAVITCIDTKVLDGALAGSYYDESFLSALPPTADPCGENGEFHSFVYDGPLFREPIAFTPGEFTLRDGRFAYRDLIACDGQC